MDKIVTGGLEERALSAILIENFSVMHTVDAFYPGEESFPGTYQCRYCDSHLSTHSKKTSDLNLAHKHVHRCAKRFALEQATAVLNEECPIELPCTFQYVAAKSYLGSFRPCGKTFTTRAELSKHTLGHTLHSYVRDVTTDTKTWQCYYQGCAEDTSTRNHRSRRNRSWI